MPSWLNGDLAALYDQYLQPDWRERHADPKTRIDAKFEAGQLGRRRTQDQAGVAPDPGGPDADHLGTGRCLDQLRAGRPAADLGFDGDRFPAGLDRR